MKTNNKSDLDAIEAIIQNQASTSDLFTYLGSDVKDGITKELFWRNWWNGSGKWLFGFREKFIGFCLGAAVTMILIFFTFQQPFTVGMLVGAGGVLILQATWVFFKKFKKSF